jgi:hypothetical protein
MGMLEGWVSVVPRASISRVHAEIIAFLRNVFADVQAPNFVDRLLFGLCQPLALQQILAPGRNHHLDAINFGTRQILVQPPKGAVSTVN